ncbi:MmcQ/YjbR family DNA-binding protein [Blastococcus sp. TF02A-26]|uniref:MmcQ/YjbR family DNA-binding protein n=1 Tax=Blastococcus sp. TF02A-26 TaxID=2250577 RepID=UPI000DE87EE0|nr:MmcQ/YjbR family DNA-binding protein [Blastococcus sp. TF02A-26]RBY86180.1 hypothetical protein DQ240_10340 [Blastococcus sp. TF02A-26]
MTGPDTIADIALALPAVEQHTHFGLPAYRVADKPFAVLQPSGHAVLHADRDNAERLAADTPDACELVLRGERFIGIRVDLSRIGDDELRRLVTAAWRNKAPKRLATAHGY